MQPVSLLTFEKVKNVVLEDEDALVLVFLLNLQGNILLENFVLGFVYVTYIKMMDLESDHRDYFSVSKMSSW